VRAERSGFVTSGGKTRSSTEVTLKAGDSRHDIELRLLPQGVITGRVLDEDGDPMSAVSVQALRWQFTPGNKQLVAVFRETTNDIGEFRLTGLPPARYYLLATVTASVGRGESVYRPAFYPNALEETSAIPLAVVAGSQLRESISRFPRRGLFKCEGGWSTR
jgi:hypothetical protein